jgi:hypothetical protein
MVKDGNSLLFLVEVEVEGTQQTLRNSKEKLEN